ncbi:Hsp20/alpha crystallin family protein [Lewinella sp. IMCC34183]|uniref:Hsp20/alpha crystallin family protein n=1 Tax=Lewinella sp. IMCC34183 TaxID=2248762 RepID=UPI000E282C9A|nr:Hsp20/alpha crystallin family protein [Lewinella sp. IMCC34183]
MKSFSSFTGISPENSKYRNSDHLFDIQRKRLYGNQTIDGDYEFSVPRANITELDEENRRGYLVELAAPGYEREDFDISIHNSVMTIKAEPHDDRLRDHDSYTQREHMYHTFRRRFSLPEQADEENITAGYTRGILEVFVPVLGPVSKTREPRRITISQ